MVKIFRSESVGENKSNNNQQWQIGGEFSLKIIRSLSLFYNIEGGRVNV